MKLVNYRKYIMLFMQLVYLLCCSELYSLHREICKISQKYFTKYFLKYFMAKKFHEILHHYL